MGTQYQGERGERVLYAYTRLIDEWQLGMDVDMPGPLEMEMEHLFYAITRLPPSTTYHGYPIIQ